MNGETMSAIKRTLILLLIPLALGLGTALASPAHLCAPDLIGPVQYELLYNYSTNPLTRVPFGLSTSEKQTVRCNDNQQNPCVVGWWVQIHETDPQGPPYWTQQPCKNFIIACGSETDMEMDCQWGPLPAGTYELTDYFYFSGCNPDGMVNVTSTKEFEVQ